MERDLDSGGRLFRWDKHVQAGTLGTVVGRGLRSRRGCRKGKGVSQSIRARREKEKRAIDPLKLGGRGFRSVRSVGLSVRLIDCL